MSTSCSVRLVFGMDIGKKSGLLERLWPIVDKHASVDVAQHAGYEDASRAILYVRESIASLLEYSEVPDKPVDVSMHIAGAPLITWTDTLRAFCEQHGVKYQPPRWLAVAYVG